MSRVLSFPPQPTPPDIIELQVELIEKARELVVLHGLDREWGVSVDEAAARALTGAYFFFGPGRP